MAAMATIANFKGILLNQTKFATCQVKKSALELAVPGALRTG